MFQITGKGLIKIIFPALAVFVVAAPAHAQLGGIGDSIAFSLRQQVCVRFSIKPCYWGNNVDIYPSGSNLTVVKNIVKKTKFGVMHVMQMGIMCEEGKQRRGKVEKACSLFDQYKYILTNPNLTF